MVAWGSMTIALQASVGTAWCGPAQCRKRCYLAHHRPRHVATRCQAGNQPDADDSPPPTATRLSAIVKCVRLPGASCSRRRCFLVPLAAGSASVGLQAGKQGGRVQAGAAAAASWCRSQPAALRSVPTPSCPLATHYPTCASALQAQAAGGVRPAGRARSGSSRGAAAERHRGTRAPGVPARRAGGDGAPARCRSGAHLCVLVHACRWGARAQRYRNINLLSSEQRHSPTGLQIVPTGRPVLVIELARGEGCAESSEALAALATAAIKAGADALAVKTDASGTCCGVWRGLACARSPPAPHACAGACQHRGACTSLHVPARTQPFCLAACPCALVAPCRHAITYQR